MGLRHKIIRLLEQPSIPKEIIFGIVHGHSHCCQEAFKLLGEKPKMFIDIGANSGEVIKALRFNFGNIKTIAFEPLKEYIQKLNNFGNIQVYNFGLWNKNETRIFNINKEVNAESSFLNPKNFNPEKRKIELKRFDSLDIKIERPCFCKVDVEGAEEKVLEGFGNKLKEIDVLQLELLFSDFFKNQSKLSNIMKILEKYEFIGFKQLNTTYELNKPLKCDLIFFKNKINPQN